MIGRAPTGRDGTVPDGTTRDRAARIAAWKAAVDRVARVVGSVGARSNATVRSGVQSHGNRTATGRITGSTAPIYHVISMSSRATPPGFEPGLPT